MGCSASVARPNDEKSAPISAQKDAGVGAGAGGKPGAGAKAGWSGGGGKAGAAGAGAAAPNATPAEETEEQWLAADAGGIPVPLQLPPHLPRGLRKFWSDCFSTEVVTFDKFFDQVILETEEQIPALADTARARIAERLRAAGGGGGGGAGVLPPDEQLLRQLLRQAVLEMEPPGPGVNSRFSSADLQRLAHM